MAKHQCRLRKLRKTAKLSQRELALLIGLRSQGLLSEIETGLKQPSLSVALASALALGEALADIYPGLFANVHRLTLARAKELQERLQRHSGRSTAAKSSAGIVERLTRMEP